jgi:hypothetical protein
MENASLVNITNDNETVKLLNHTSQSPTTLEVKNNFRNKTIKFDFFRKLGV